MDDPHVPRPTRCTLSPYVRQVTRRPGPPAALPQARSSRSTSGPRARRSATASPRRNRLDGTAYYTFDRRRRAVHRARHREPERLRRRLARRHPVRLAAASSWPPRADRLVVVASHHTIGHDDEPARRHRRRHRAAGARRRGRRALLAQPERDRLGQRAHAPQPDVGAQPSRPATERLLGDQHRLARRLAAAVAAHRDRRQRRRHAVDLHHDGRPRRPRVVRRSDRLARRGWPGWRASWRRTTGTNARRPPRRRRRRATSSCWSPTRCSDAQPASARLRISWTTVVLASA